MKISKILIILTCTLFLAANAFAQKATLETDKEVAAAATSELDLLMQDPKFIKETDKQQISGSYTYQITVKDKGMIASMLFLEKSEDGDIKGQNYFNNLVRNHKFQFKVPKGKYYKFNYTFKI